MVDLEIQQWWRTLKKVGRNSYFKGLEMSLDLESEEDPLLISKLTYGVSLLTLSASCTINFTHLKVGSSVLELVVVLLFIHYRKHIFVFACSFYSKFKEEFYTHSQSHIF